MWAVVYTLPDCNLIVRGLTFCHSDEFVGYCMEEMSGDEGLESSRVTYPSSENQSTLVNSENAWTVSLQDKPLESRDKNPKVTVNFRTEVEVRALKIQGSGDEAKDLTFILSFWNEESEQFEDYLSGPKVSV